MSDQETLNRAFAQAVATGTSTVLVSMPNRAGKSTLHRQIQQANNHFWFESLESRYNLTDEEVKRYTAAFDESMTNTFKGQDWMSSQAKASRELTSMPLKFMDLPKGDG